MRLATTLAWCPKLSQAWFHEGAVNDARFSADGARVVTACEDGTAHVWDTRTGYGRFWVVTNDYEIVPRSQARTAQAALARHLRTQRTLNAVLAEQSGEDVPARAGACPSA